MTSLTLHHYHLFLLTAPFVLEIYQRIVSCNLGDTTTTEASTRHHDRSDRQRLMSKVWSPVTPISPSPPTPNSSVCLVFRSRHSLYGDEHQLVWSDDVEVRHPIRLDPAHGRESSFHDSCRQRQHHDHLDDVADVPKSLDLTSHHFLPYRMWVLCGIRYGLSLGEHFHLLPLVLQSSLSSMSHVGAVWD